MDIHDCTRLGRGFAPIMGWFIAFLVIGLAMPVLPLHVHQGLALAPRVGLVAVASSPRRSFLGCGRPASGWQGAQTHRWVGWSPQRGRASYCYHCASSAPRDLLDDLATWTGPARRRGKLHHQGAQSWG